MNGTFHLFSFSHPSSGWLLWILAHFCWWIYSNYSALFTWNKRHVNEMGVSSQSTAAQINIEIMWSNHVYSEFSPLHVSIPVINNNFDMNKRGPIKHNTLRVLINTRWKRIFKLGCTMIHVFAIRLQNELMNVLSHFNIDIHCYNGKWPHDIYAFALFFIRSYRFNESSQLELCNLFKQRERNSKRTKFNLYMECIHQ